MKKYRFLIASVLLLLVSLWGYNKFVNSKKQRNRAPEKVEKTAFVETVKNAEIPIVINERGNLKAKNRLLLFSEVQTDVTKQFIMTPGYLIVFSLQIATLLTTMSLMCILHNLLRKKAYCSDLKTALS